MEYIIIIALAVAIFLFLRSRQLKGQQDSQKADQTSSESKPAPAAKTAAAKPAAKKPVEKKAAPATATESKPAKKPAASKSTATKKASPAKKPAAKAASSTVGSDNPEQALASEKDPLTRHRLLVQLTEAAYKQRKKKAERERFYQLAEQHISEFADIKAPLKKSNGGKLPQVMTFQNYANLLTEDGQFDKAVDVCEQALKHGLDDKTQTGFKGRIERIKAKAKKA